MALAEKDCRHGKIEEKMQMTDGLGGGGGLAGQVNSRVLEGVRNLLPSLYLLSLGKTRTRKKS